MRSLKVLYLPIAFAVVCASAGTADEQLRSLGQSVGDVQQASAVLHTLSQRDDLQLTQVLTALKEQSQVAKNWYLSLAEVVAQRDKERALAQCRQFLELSSEDGAARYWAFSYLIRHQPESKSELLENRLDDTSLDLRYEAIELQLSLLQKSPPATDQEKQTAYQQLLAAARLPSQIQQIAKQLETLDTPVDLLNHFGFISQWYTVGTFDNSQGSGFESAYPPETDYLSGKLTYAENSLSASSYQGKEGTVGWKQTITSDSEGMIDLAKLYDKAKGVAVYALGNFVSSQDQMLQVRVGCINAIKVWVNGQPLISREVYHAGGQIDQYSAPVKVRAGDNLVLIKICQNEQTESWAQEYYFQCRFCDSTGLAVRSATVQEPNL